MDERPLARAEQVGIVVPFLLVTAIWGSTWLVIRDQVSVVPPSWSLAYRFLVGAVAMFVVALVTKERLGIGPRGQAFAVLVGLSQFVLNFNFVYRAELFITSGLVALLYALLIVPNALLAWLFLGEGVSRRFLAGATVSMAGMALLFVHELDAAQVGPRAVATGVALSLLGILCASVSNVMQASRLGKSLAMAPVLAWAMLWGAGGNALYALATAGPPVVEPRWGYLGGVLYLGILGSAITFPLYFGLIRRIGAARAAYTSVLIPVIAMGLSTAFEGYRWSVEAVAGCALVLAGLVVALRARSPAR